jgi:hypothetical protein
VKISGVTGSDLASLRRLEATASLATAPARLKKNPAFFPGFSSRIRHPFGSGSRVIMLRIGCEESGDHPSRVA